MLNVGIIGAGHISESHIKSYQANGNCVIKAIADLNLKNAQKRATEFGIEKAYADYWEILNDDSIDAVSIATPTFTHKDIVIDALNSGKHVLCEKPFASNAREVRQMIEAAQKYGVTLMEAMISTLNPNFAIVKEHLKDLGTLRRYFASYCQYSSRYDKFKEGIVLNAFKPELSNGAMMDIGIYTVYPMVALFGRPQKVEAQGIRLHTGVDGQGAVNFQYEGMNATVLYSKIANSSLPTEIEGEKGNLILDKIHITNHVDFIPRQVVGQGQEQANIPHSIGVSLDKSPYYYEMAEFMNLIEQGKQESSVNSWDCSLGTIEIIDEVRRQLGVRYPADK